ncbi:MAG TPA: hypothetical protein ENN55_02675 [Firmicutes bacterium]|nr:hypothetical protein [Bacillota bacterium]
MDRIKIKDAAGRLRVEISSHNSILHAVFAVIVLSAVFLFLYYMLPAAFLLFRQKFFMTAGNIILIMFGGFVVFMISRAVLWTIGGYEIIEAGPDGIHYSKKIFGKGETVFMPADKIKEIKTIDFVRPKEILYMIRSEFGFNGRSFAVETEDKIFVFGIYLSFDEAVFIENALFSAVERAKGLPSGFFRRSEP